MSIKGFFLFLIR